MALSHQSVFKAKQILSSIGNLSGAGLEATEDNYESTGIILLEGCKHDGGYESVYINIQSISNEQLDEFELRKNEIPNSSINRSKGSLTTIGWF